MTSPRSLTRRIRVEHSSRYAYVNPVRSSFNEVRITPMTTRWQLVLESRVEVTPSTPLQAYVDYWASVVHAFDLHQPHDELTIVGRSVVETSPPVYEPEHLAWADLQDRGFLDLHSELLAPTRYVPCDPRLVAEAIQLQTGRTPREAAVAAVDWVRSQLTYVPGTTGVHTSALEAWNGAEGVCQDFAHLTLAVVRAMGLPARYCSGYMLPTGDAEIGETLEGESHAWLEVWTGDWQALDPTAGRSIDAHYVLVARGRDYADVPPVKGIFHGGPTARLDVSVNLTRTA